MAEVAAPAQSRKRGRSQLVGLPVGRNSFSKGENNEQSPKSKKPRPDAAPKNGDSELTPPGNDSPSSAIVTLNTANTPDSISSKPSSRFADGGSRGSTKGQLFSRFPAQGSLESFRAAIKERVVDNIKVITDTPTVKSGLEAAASIDILNLTQASDPLLENVATIVRRGAMLMEEGQNKVTMGEEMLKVAFKEILGIFNLT